MPGDTKPFEIRFQPASDQSLLLYFGDRISPPTHQKIAKFLKQVSANPVAGVVNLQPAYASVLIKFDLRTTNHDAVESAVRERLRHIEEVKLPAPRLREIAVCYGGEFGPDLQDLAGLHGVAPDEVVKLHSNATYTVYFLGFVPGFAYLGGLPEQLATPRLATPRKAVPAGSVAIGGSQTGVYPASTPGGWRIIGRTPHRLFDPSEAHASFFELGDEVRFRPISGETFVRMATQSR
ncbi:MAG TPA: 5-oxoprolinase subunit PxpB [Candidatus Acidoferrum sp.]|nr:5-oxoprolinase subunit PxpB [Candidatus Acidoferrum sp.]